MPLHANRNILIVDDSTFILSIVERALIKEFDTITIHKAQSFSQAEEITQRVFFHAAIVDVTLPDAPDGAAVDLTIALGIPTIVLTGTDDTQIQKDILSKNIFDLILKNNSNNLPYVVFSIKRILKNYCTNVLIVDDSRSTRNLIAKLLKKLHLTVHEAEDPIEAFEILANPAHQIALVLTDYEMPQMNGLEFTLLLRQTYRKDRLSIIALSAVEDKGLPARFLKHGANDFLQKPFDQDELYVRINSNLELLEMFNQHKEITNKDHLTGLFSRQYFFEHAAIQLAEAHKTDQALSVTIFDIDHVKIINQEYGYEAGDTLIKGLADMIISIYPKSTLVARLGGEKIYVLESHTILENSLKYAEKVRQKIEQLRIHYKNTILSFTVSGGLYFGLPASMYELLESANSKLKKAKRSGKNRIVSPQDTFSSIDNLINIPDSTKGNFDLFEESIFFE